MQANTHFGHYLLERLLGAGGMGQVWLAFDTQTERQVAVKVLPPAFSHDEDYRQRFLREAKVAAALREPHIVPIHSFGTIDDQLYIDMAYIEGRDVGSLLKEGPLPVPKAVDIIAQTGDALDAAHEAGLVHRDVKPSNLLLTHRKGFVYLIDFGIAFGTQQTRLTGSGLSVGTLEYMAPERFVGTFDASVDVYALACVLYHCLTGRPPFGNTTPERQMHGHIGQPPPRPSAANSAVPVALDAVIARGMAKKPRDRYATAGDLGEAARAALVAAPPRMMADDEEPTVPAPAPALPRPAPSRVLPPPGTRVARPMVTPPIAPPRPERNRGRWVIFAALVGVVLLVSAAVAYIYSTRTTSTDNAGSSDVSTTTAPIGPPSHTATVDVGDHPIGISIDSAAQRAYVTNISDGSVSVIDVDQLAVVSTIRVGTEPAGIAVDPAARKLYVVNSADGNVSVVDSSSGVVLGSVDVGNNPWDIAVDPATHTAYVANQDDGTVSIIEGDRVVDTVTVGANPIVPQIDPDTRVVYVSNLNDASVSVIDMASRDVVDTIQVGNEPNGIAIDPATRTAFVTNRADGTISVFDTATREVIDTVDVGGRPVAVAIDPTAHTAYISGDRNEWLTTVDTATRKVTGSYGFADSPVGVAVDLPTHRAFVNSYEDGTVSVVSR
ncbi:serine/threonine-protein kinase [Antrihabitans sp. YC2-6]|uniref:serine/threonine-protein kinase n=1 Tax=Antrihabitans sp. YC2-6 TaxID=2799498 RepID=UPI0018F73E6F|nr:serine/threonine-protein kinase [Antrihabitans sp. YC2-6]MBJ8347808.1 protein kinase [Antrihabitans sp. YC2-6]